MSKFAVIFLLVLGSITTQAQNYYVSIQTHLKEAPNEESNPILKLSEHDNLVLLDSIDGKWIRVNYNSKEGFVNLNSVKKGKAIVTTTSYRVGAVCKDGTTSSATGRGACSHHGGVSYWRTKEKKTVRIVED